MKNIGAAIAYAADLLFSTRGRPLGTRIVRHDVHHSPNANESGR